MGQAAVDLPDPLEDAKGAAAQTPVNTDDLLAELASIQIDQMLAEAELDRPFDGLDNPTDIAAAVVDDAARQMISPPAIVRQSTAADDLSPQSAEAAIHSGASEPTIEDLDEAASQQLEELFDELQANAAENAPAPRRGRKSAPPESPAASIATAPAIEAARCEPIPSQALSSGPVDPKVDEQLTALFAGLDTPPNPETARAVAAALDPTEQTGRLEQQVLAEDAVLRATAMLAEPPPVVAAPARSNLREPLYLRLLKWINTPLEWCSESARQVMGKVAIFTLINALAVLAYVLFFRK